MHVPSLTSHISKPRAPSLTLTVKVTQRNATLRKLKINKSIENWNNYKMLRYFSLASLGGEKTANLGYLNRQLSSAFYNVNPKY